VLLKLIARAHCWFDDLISGRAASMVEIAKREKVGKRYVSRVIRLAFLAPEIVEQIVNGCQPPELTAQSLLNDRTELRLAYPTWIWNVCAALTIVFWSATGRIFTSTLSDRSNINLPHLVKPRGSWTQSANRALGPAGETPSPARLADR